ncbi:putative non-specific serine/threonine protein kinase [Rosa chinensis]|uniref:Putative non-specific serine/threonine protein kinase n=1 Tax=Rosa chinensis TaxID=74649 RepID=A0A2P6P8E4_ROSCH|nr:putative non-specific serine/threonine protein kinase [Rosa chinensis]
MIPTCWKSKLLKGATPPEQQLQSSIPPQIGDLRRLQVSSLQNNSLSDPIPANISNDCFKLYYLHFGRNSRVGEIPFTLGSLSKLQIFVLQHNKLIPTSLGNLSSLEVLVTSSNNLVRGIPSSLGQLKKLTFLSLGDNGLSGTKHSSIYNLSAIGTLSALLNQLEGSIPSNSSNAFPNLHDYNIAANRFIGAID